MCASRPGICWTQVVDRCRQYSHILRIGRRVGTLQEYLSIPVTNLAFPGESSRSFYTGDRWNDLISKSAKGNLVIIEMGHNDEGDPTNLRNFKADHNSLPGVDMTQTVQATIRGKTETVHTCGYYLRSMIEDAKNHSLIALMTPSNKWQEHKFQTEWPYANWAEQMAKEYGAEWIPQTKYSVARYQKCQSLRSGLTLPMVYITARKALSVSFHLYNELRISYFVL
jgi:hypothetical protein